MSYTNVKFMSKESLTDLEGPITAPQVICRLLGAHPEIIQITIAAYPPQDHGERAVTFFRQFFPVLPELVTLAHGDWRRTNLLVPEIVAVGSIVDVCDRAGCDHHPASHFEDQLWLWERWHEGASAPQGLQSFIFLDIETYGPETLDPLLTVLTDVSSPWYVLDSGHGFHVIFDQLVGLGDLAGKYGEIISLFGRRLENRQLERWGEDLRINGNNHQGVSSWCGEVIDTCGHLGDPLSLGKQVHLIDLRHVAHSLKRLDRFQQKLRNTPSGPGLLFLPEDEIGGAYLRISPKRQGSLPPVLVAQNIGQGPQIFRLPDYGFSLQPRLL